jgi:carbonic anhydrase
MSATEEFLENNQRYAAGFTKGDLPVLPSSKTVVVTCMDSRLDPARFLGLEEGEAHVLRNAGGVVTDDTIRSLVLSQRLLGTEEILLVQHTNCGMSTLRGDDVMAELETETGIRPAFDLEAISDPDAGVRQSIARIQASPFVLHKHAIRGFVYDVNTGRLREVR